MKECYFEASKNILSIFVAVSIGQVVQSATMLYQIRFDFIHHTFVLCQNS